jgi:succinyl-CoA synthetase beta subunit
MIIQNENTKRQQGITKSDDRVKERGKHASITTTTTEIDLAQYERAMA